MKKTVNININRIAFIIDEEAHKILEDYLKSIETHYNKNEDCKEIMQDIEARIQELLSEKLHQGKMIIEAEDINEIINIMGRPSQFEDEENQENEENKENAKMYKHIKNWRSRRLYKDPENKIIAGVCSGLASYMNIDPTIVRIIIILITILGGIAPITIIGYLILTIILPKAITASQRLEMRGEIPTIENIKSYLDGDKFKIQNRKAQTILGKIFSVFIKTIFIIITGIMVLSIFAAAVTAIFIIFSIGTNVLFAPNFMVIPFIALGLFLCIIPIYAIVKLIIKTFNNSLRNTPRLDWTLGILWIVALLSFTSIGVMSMDWSASTTGFYNWSNNLDLNKPHKSYKSVDWKYGEKKELAGFNSITVSDNVKAEIIPSDSYYMEISDSNSNRDKLIYKIKDSTLLISRRNKIKNKTIDIKIYMPNYKKIVSSAGSKIKALELNNRKNVTLTCTSGSKIYTIIQSVSVNALAQSAGKITIEGTTNNAIYTTSSGSKIDAEKCFSNTVKAKASSGSKIECQFNKKGTLQASSGAKIDYDAPISAKTTLKQSSGGDIDKD